MFYEDLLCVSVVQVCTVHINIELCKKKKKNPNKLRVTLHWVTNSPVAEGAEYRIPRIMYYFN